MQDLIKMISSNTGIPDEKSEEIILTISAFIKEKYPLLASMVDSVLDITPNEKREFTL